VSVTSTPSIPSYHTSNLEDVNQLPVENTSDASKDFYNSEEEYNFGGVLSDDNDEDISFLKDTNTTRDNENDDEFSDNNEEDDNDSETSLLRNNTPK
ncbi:792_t:CDS:2, partial [Acaulospora colombiana]